MTEHMPPIGQPQALARGLERILAPNPSAMTYWGTNTYLVGSGETLAVIDPGPDDPAHLQAILSAAGRRRISHIIVTHSHLDHSALAAPLSQASGAPVVGYGPATAGRSAAMQALVDSGLKSGGEGIDHGFVPDIVVTDGAVLAGDGWNLRVLHTPGHLGNHICLLWEGGIFTGDHVMGWSTSLVSPPDGDLTDFMASCDRLARVPTTAFFPGHGAPVTDPAERLAWLTAHRRNREREILNTLRSHPAGLTPAQLTSLIYLDTPQHLHPAACRNVLAHLVDLTGRNLVSTPKAPSESARFHTVERPPK